LGFPYVKPSSGRYTGILFVPTCVFVIYEEVLRKS
jgi:hypothetical protein